MALRNKLFKQGGSFDSVNTPIFVEELRAIEATVMREQFKPRKGERLVPVVTDVPAGAQEWGYDKITPFGLSQWMSSLPGQIPMANVDKERVTFKIHQHGIGYKYGYLEGLSAQMSGFPLDSERLRAAREGAESTRNAALISGVPQLGFKGLINSDDVPQTTATDPGAGTEWANKTADEIIDDVNEWIELIRVHSQDKYESGFTLVLPEAAWGKLQKRSAIDGVSVRKYLDDNLGGKIVGYEVLSELTGAGEGGTDRAILYPIDPAVVKAKFAMLFQFVGTEQHLFEIIRGGLERMGGVVWIWPLAALYIDGV